MEKLTKYIKQTTINEFKEKGITFEPYIQRSTWTDVIDGKLVTRVTNEIKHTDVWLIKKPKVKSRKALNEHGLAEIVSADGFGFDNPEARYVLDGECGIRFAFNDYLGCYYASTIGELIDDYNRDVVFDPNNQC
jgi:hypothetical protein